jgi:hypothetical protein
MTNPVSWQEMVDKAWGYARQARQDAREARARATLATQNVQRAYHRAGMAWLALSMVAANPVTRVITASILARHGLLDEKPAFRSARDGRHRRSPRPTRPATGTPP